MKHFSNRYMMLYALGIAAVVAVLLTVVSTSLRERQHANVHNEQLQMLLAAIGIECDRDEAPALYLQYFTADTTVEGSDLPLYRFHKDALRGFVVPMQGKGLWGNIYANVALADDFNTIVGITFSHDSETPGLGAEITSSDFCNQFVGKQILDGDGRLVSIAVVKQADPEALHEVDAISGGTMTSNGVGEMLAQRLALYEPFIDALRDEQ